MNGYGSKRQVTGAERCRVIQMITNTVCRPGTSGPDEPGEALRERPKVSGSMSSRRRPPRDVAAAVRGDLRHRRPPSGPSGPSRGLAAVVVLVGRGRVPPVVGQQVVEHVVDGDGAEQVVLVVDDRRADQVVRREVAGDLGQRGVRATAAPSRCRSTPADQLERRLAQQPLDVHAAQVAAGRVSLRRAADEHLEASAGVRSGLRIRASASATVASGAQDHRLRRHQAAGGVCRVLQQPPDRLGLLRLHQPEQLVLDRGGQLAEQVGGVVRVHRLQDVGGPLPARGGPRISFWSSSGSSSRRRPAARRRARRRPRARRFGGSVAQHAGEVGGAQPLEGRRAGPRCPGRSVRREPGDRASRRPPAPGPRRRQAGCGAPARRAGRPPSRGCGSAPSPRRRRSRPRRCRRADRRSSSWPTTSVSLGRCSNRRMLTDPVASVTRRRRRR